MKLYAVMGPEYGETIPICDDGTGPTEWVGAYVEVEAENASDAKVFGWRLLKAQPGFWRWHEPGENPFGQLEVKEICRACYESDEPCKSHSGE